MLRRSPIEKQSMTSTDHHIDFNVPAVGSEQMYQALKTLGVPTQFIVYPGQHHGLTVPSYLKDRYTRYLDWFGKYMGDPKLKDTLPPKK